MSDISTDLARGLTAEDIINPYWEAIKNHPTDEVFSTYGRRSIEAYGWRKDEDGKIVMDYEESARYIKRSDAVIRWSWSIPDPEVLDWLAAKLDGRAVVEIGAGTGYWSFLMRQLGVDWTCYDLHPPEEGQNHYHSNATGNGRAQVWDQQYDRILVGGTSALRNKPNHDRVLFLSWPPYGASMAFDCLQTYRGDTLVYIGESEGGCTGDDQFFELLEDKWTLVEEFHMIQWSGIHDNAYLYTRKVKELS